MKLFGRRGSSQLEFVMLGIPMIFMHISVVEGSLAMWQYHTLEECAAVGARYVITHGADCAGSCTVNVGQVVSRIAAAGVGLDPGNLTIKLKSASGSTTYSPAKNYESNNTTFPPSADAAVGDYVTVTVSYPVTNPLVMFWPGTTGPTMATSVTLEAVSRQEIVY